MGSFCITSLVYIYISRHHVSRVILFICYDFIEMFLHNILQLMSIQKGSHVAKSIQINKIKFAHTIVYCIMADLSRIDPKLWTNVVGSVLWLRVFNMGLQWAGLPFPEFDSQITRSAPLFKVFVGSNGFLISPCLPTLLGSVEGISCLVLLPLGVVDSKYLGSNPTRGSLKI